MKKRIFSLFIALALIFSGSACSGSKNTEIVCSECEKVIAEDSKFCSFCGALVDASKEEESTTGSLDIENDIKFIKKIFSCGEIETLAMKYPKDITSYEDLTIGGSFANINGLYEIVLLDNGDILRVIFRWEESEGNVSEKELADIIENTLNNDSELELSYYAEKELWFEFTNEDEEIETSGSIYKWEEVCLNAYLPEPKSKYGVVQTNSPDDLYMIVEGISYKAFETYVNECVQFGYNIDAADSNGEYEAFSADNGRLSVEYFSYDKAMHISLEILVNGTFRWHELYFAGLLPVPNSKTGNVHNNNDARCDLYIGGISKTDFIDYLEECKKYGFVNDSLEYEEYYFATNPDGYELTIEYYGCDVIYIEVYDPRWEERDGTPPKAIYTPEDKSASNKHSSINNAKDVPIEIVAQKSKGTEYGYSYAAFTVKNVSGANIHTLTLNIKILDENQTVISTTHPQEGVVIADGESIIIEAMAEESAYSMKLDGYSFYIGEGFEGDYIQGHFDKTEEVILDVNQSDETSLTNDAPQNSEPENKDNDDAKLNEFIDGDCFVYTPRDFMKQFDSADKSAKGYNYVYARQNDAADLFYELADIENGYETIGMVSFVDDEDSTLSIDDDYSENIINTINILVEDIDNVPTVLVSAICAADTSLDYSAAYNLGLNVAEEAGTAKGYDCNGINYVIATDGEYYYIIISII